MRSSILSPAAHVVRVEVAGAELPVRQPARQVAAVVEHGGDVRHLRAGEFDAGDVGLVHAQHDVGVEPAGMAARGGAVQVAGEG